MEQLISGKVVLDPPSPHDHLESIHGSSDSGNMSGGEMSPEALKQADYADIKHQVQNSIRAGSKRTPEEIEEAIMRKKLRNRESAQRARDRQKARWVIVLIFPDGPIFCFPFCRSAVAVG